MAMPSWCGRRYVSHVDTQGSAIEEVRRLLMPCTLVEFLVLQCFYLGCMLLLTAGRNSSISDFQLCPPTSEQPGFVPAAAHALLRANLEAAWNLLWSLHPDKRGAERVKLIAVLKNAFIRLPAAPEAMAAFYETLEAAPDAYAVASVADALAVRRATPRKPVLVLYPVEVELVWLLWSEKIDVAISSAAWVEGAAKILRGLPQTHRLGVHLFVDTGHARSGAAPEDAGHILARVLHHSQVLQLRGIMSHFCCDPPGDMGQFSLPDVLRVLGVDLGQEWNVKRMHQEASRMHELQKRRITHVFSALGDQVAEFHASMHTMPQHSLLRHVATSMQLEKREAEVLYDAVRIGTLLIRGTSGEWAGRAPDQCLLGKLDWCRAGVRVQAVKMLRGSPGAEWCFNYGCLKGPQGATLPFMVARHTRVASISGFCHELADPYSAVQLETNRSGSSAIFTEAIGDRYGRVVVLPRGATLIQESTTLIHA